MDNCDLCNRRMSEKVREQGCVCLTSDWEMFFCKKCYPEVLEVIEATEKKYKQFHHARNHKDFEKDLFFWYKLQEWAYIEFVFKKKLNAQANKKTTEEKG